jgi:16S rRNA (uracil1498-N3)-methyltransferase
MQHFLVDQDISGEHAVISDEEMLHQMKNVLRFVKGDECVLMDGKGSKVQAVVENIDKKTIIMNLASREQIDPSNRRAALYVAVSKKPATFELIIQKATELGITDIIPLVTERCQVREIRNQKRLLHIIKEATEQSERAFLPELHEVLKWSDFLKNKPGGKILTGDARMHDLKLGGLKLSDLDDINLVIGPEGGLTDKELSDIHEIGGEIFILRDTVLRMETAAIAAMSIILCR